jgi:membrane protein implicated in regulation of membrane protease activity
MNEWWEALTSLQKFFYVVSIPSTIILVLQFILSFIGVGDGDVDIDTDMDVTDTDLSTATEIADFRFVTFRGIIAFLSIFGWVGAVLAAGNMNVAIILLLSTASGLLAMGFVAYLFYAVSKLQSSGNLDYKKSIGGYAEVYIPIAANNESVGKIQVNVSGRLIEAEAITHGDVVLKTGDIVRVVDVFNETIFVVEKEN